MPIIIQGYLEGYKLSYTIDGYTSIVANSSNIYRFQINQENIDQSIWKPDYPNKTISFYNTTTRVLETRILKSTDYYYYATVPNSVLTSKGRLYVTINFFNEDYGIVTKEMDNPIFIQASEQSLPIEEEDQKIIRYEFSLDENHLEIPSDFYYIDNYTSLLQVYYEGKLLSSPSEYSIDTTTHILTLKDSIFVQGGRVILILHVPCDCGEGGSVAIYAEEAGRLRNSLFIGEIEYNGEESVSLPPIPNAAVEYVTQKLEEAQQTIARKNISAAKITVGKEPSNPQVGDIWITDEGTNIYALPFVSKKEAGKILQVNQNGEWWPTTPTIYEHRVPEAKNYEGMFLQANKGAWTPVSITSRLLREPSSMSYRDNTLHAYVIDPETKQYSIKSVRELYTPQFAEITLLGGNNWKYDEKELVYKQSVPVVNITSSSVLLATPGPYSYFNWVNNSMSLEGYQLGTLVFKSYAQVLDSVNVNLIYFGEKTEKNTLSILPEEEGE